MGYRKFKADFIFTGLELHDSNHVLLVNNEGVVEAIVDENEAGDNVESFEGMLTPGFINCHCHLELSCLKNVIGPGSGLVNFLMAVISKRGKTEMEIQEAMVAADTEMFNNGIVAVGDICNTTNSITVKKQSRLYYRNFVEALGFSEERAATVLQSYRTVFDAFAAAGFSNDTSIAPHAPYTVSAALFALINETSAGKTISIHNQETLAEDELYRYKTGDFFRLYQHLNIDTGFFQPYGKSSLQSYMPLLHKPQSILLVHNSFTTPDDVHFAAAHSALNQQQFFWCLCPNANLYIENCLPPVEMLIENQCTLVLGTDSYASNRGLDILSEIKTLQQHFPALTATRLLQWATANGAAALGKSDSLGSFEKGKKPGVVLIDGLSNGQISATSQARRLL